MFDNPFVALAALAALIFGLKKFGPADAVPVNQPSTPEMGGPLFPVSPTPDLPHPPPVPLDAPLAIDYAPGYGPGTSPAPAPGPAPVTVPTPAPTATGGRWKDDGHGGCYFDANDDGPDQCVPPVSSSSPAVEPQHALLPPSDFPPMPAGAPIYGTVESGPLRVDGVTFRDSAGNIWSYRGVTMFMLMARWLRGEDISTQILWAQSFGANVLRVFGRVPASTVSGWKDWPDYEHPESAADFADKLGKFFDLVAGYGVRVEYVPLTWAAPVATMRQWVQQAFDVAANHWNVLIEVANEPEVNGVDTVSVMQGVNTRGVIYALGNYVNRSDGSLPHGNYVTAHTDRDSEWPRRGHDAIDYRDGGGPFALNDIACKCPIVLDEPIGADETDQAGRRTTSAADYMAYVGVARLMAAGVTFHCQCGLMGRSPNTNEPIQAQIAQAVGQTWTAIVADAQIGAYQRCGGGGFPTTCDPAESLRSYGSVFGGQWAVVRVRPNGGLPIVQTSGGGALTAPGMVVVSTPTASGGSTGTTTGGRWKDDGHGGCYFDVNDSGPDQCHP